MQSPSITVGMRIRRCREQKGLSRARVAKLLGVDVTAVSAWENGKYRPRVNKRLELARVLDVALDQLFPQAEPAQSVSAPILRIPNHDEFATLLLEETASARTLIRAVHCSRVVATRPGLLTAFRNLIAERLLAGTVVMEHIEVIQDLLRLKEIAHNILRYDGCGYNLRAYVAAPSVVSPGPNAFLFDDSDLILGSSWSGDPTGDALRLSIHGGELVDYFLQRWSDMWNDATPLNPDGAADLSAVQFFASELGLAPSDWSSFLEDARSLTLPDGVPPFT